MSNIGEKYQHGSYLHESRPESLRSPGLPSDERSEETTNWLQSSSIQTAPKGRQAWEADKFDNQPRSSGEGERASVSPAGQLLPSSSNIRVGKLGHPDKDVGVEDQWNVLTRILMGWSGPLAIIRVRGVPYDLLNLSIFVNQAPFMALCVDFQNMTNFILHLLSSSIDNLHR